MRVKRDVDVASDHHLVIARLQLKLIRNDVDQERRKGRYNVDYLKDKNTAQEYKVTLSNRFKVLHWLYDEDEGVNTTGIGVAVNTTCGYWQEETTTERLDFSGNRSNRSM